MSSAKEMTAYTLIDRENFDFTWIIGDYTLALENESKLTSPSFNVGKDDEKQFQLTVSNLLMGSSCKILLHLVCLKAIKPIPLKYNLSVIKDNNVVLSLKASASLSQSTTKTILEIPKNDMDKFISSTDTVTLRCELSVSVGPPKNLLSHECAKMNEVPKLTFDWIFLQEHLSDVWLTPMSGPYIPAHRVVLAAASPVFEAMFRHRTREQKYQSVVDMKDVSRETAVEMLRYIYQGNFEKRGIPFAIDLLAVAHKYQLKVLKNQCEQMIGSNLSTENAIDILKVAKKYGTTYLIKKTVDYIKFDIIGTKDSGDLRDIILNMAELLSE